MIDLLAAALLALHAGLLGWGAARHSPAWVEPQHLVAGISHWEFGTFDLYRVNPPLVRMVGGVPAVLADPEMDWRRYDASVGVRSERSIAQEFMTANGARVFYLHTLARWACIPFSLLGGYICFRWARDLYGEPAAILALSLWCFAPNIIAHGQMITPDVGAAALGVTAAYVFWRWLKSPSLRRALAAGLALGLAELTKTSWIVLFALWPLLWLVWRWPCRHELSRSSWLRESRQLAVVLLFGLYMINLGYGFEGSFQKLGDYGFVSETLGGARSGSTSGIEVRNRFQNTWLAKVPVPLPRNYVMGIDLQKSDFERKSWSHLRGEWRQRGWWYYYLYALAIKVPLGTWTLILLALLVGLFGRGYAASWPNELLLLAPIVVILTLVSSQTGFNRHMRYVLPIFPFAFIWMSKVARAFEFRRWKLAAVVVVAMVWSVGSSLSVYPHSLSYFNELAGGPRNGHAHLHDSNIDWGQDLLYLKRWLDKHPEAQPLHMTFFGSYRASIADIEYTDTPTDPQPGWHVMSVNKIYSHKREYEYFLHFEPVAMAGYSIYIYHIRLDDANRVRRELGLPELSEDWLETVGDGAHDDAR